MQTLIDLAYCWHSGGGSAMYQFASNQEILDEPHRDKLIEEVEKILKETEEDTFLLSLLWSHAHVALNPEDWSHSLVEWKTSRPYDGCAWEFNFGVLSRMNPGKTGIMPPENLTIFTPAYISSCIAKNIHVPDLTGYVLRSLASGTGTDFEWREYPQQSPSTLCQEVMADRHLPAAGLCFGALGVGFSVPCWECGEPVDLGSAFHADIVCELCKEEFVLDKV